MLRCLGVPVLTATNLYSDNQGVTLSATTPEADLKKKHVMISYHLVREATAAGIVAPCWIPGGTNWSDILTKQIPSTEFIGHVNDMTV